MKKMILALVVVLVLCSTAFAGGSLPEIYMYDPYPQYDENGKIQGAHVSLEMLGDGLRSYTVRLGSKMISGTADYVTSENFPRASHVKMVDPKFGTVFKDFLFNQPGEYELTFAANISGKNKIVKKNVSVFPIGFYTTYISLAENGIDAVVSFDVFRMFESTQLVEGMEVAVSIDGIMFSGTLAKSDEEDWNPHFHFQITVPGETMKYLSELYGGVDTVVTTCGYSATREEWYFYPYEN